MEQDFLKNSAFFLASLLHMTMATSPALAKPSDCTGVACRSTHRTRIDPPPTDGTMRKFVRRNCLEPVEGSAHFDDLTAHRYPPPTQGELWGQDCVPGGDDDAED
jgi:hypothetical protein